MKIMTWLFKIKAKIIKMFLWKPNFQQEFIFWNVELYMNFILWSKIYSWLVEWSLICLKHLRSYFIVKSIMLRRKIFHFHFHCEPTFLHHLFPLHCMKEICVCIQWQTCWKNYSSSHSQFKWTIFEVHIIRC